MVLAIGSYYYTNWNNGLSSNSYNVGRYRGQDGKSYGVRINIAQKSDTDSAGFRCIKNLVKNILSAIIPEVFKF